MGCGTRTRRTKVPHWVGRTLSAVLIAFGAMAAQGAKATENTVPASDGPDRSSRGELDAWSKSDQLVSQARKMIVDALPEDRLKAQDLLIEAIRISPHHTNAYAELSRFLLWQVSMRFLKPHALAQAATLARHVRELEPARPLGNYLLCEMMLALGQGKAAEVLFDQTRKEFPNHPDTAVFEARYFSESNPARALSSATKALALGVDMDSLSPAISLALENLAAGDPTRLSEDLKSFVTVYPDRWLWHRMALSYREANKHREAQSAFERAIALGNTIESRLHLGILFYEHLRQPDAATTTLEQLLAELKSKPSARPLAIGLVESHMVMAHLSANRLNKAASHADQAFQKSPHDEALVATLVHEFGKKDALALLEPPLAALVRANPEAAAGHIVLSQIAAQRKDHGLAARHMTNAIAIRPERDDLYAARALARYEMLDFALALRDFDRALELRPDVAVHHYNRACMLALLGRASDAMRSLREAVVLDAQFVAHARTDKDLASLRTRQDFVAELTELGILQASTTPLPSADRLPSRAVGSAAP